MRLSVFMILSLPLLLTGCFRDPPYVLHSGEFNRASPTFAQPVKDITEVVVCYNKRGTNQNEVKKLAVDECAKYKKRAYYLEQDYKECPILTPVSARFQCLAPPQPKTERKGESVPGALGSGKGPFYYSP